MAGKRTEKRRGASGMPPAASVEPLPAAAVISEAAAEPAAGVTEVTDVAAAPLALVLPADCRIAAQVALKQALMDALETGGIVLDGRAVERTDTAALQLLTLFQREVKARGSSLSWCGASDALNEAAGLLGLTQILELPAAALA